MLSGTIMGTTEQQGYNMFKNSKAHSGSELSGTLMNMATKLGVGTNPEIQTAAQYMRSGSDFNANIDEEIRKIIKEKPQIMMSELTEKLEATDAFKALSPEQQAAARDSYGKNLEKNKTFTVKNWAAEGGTRALKEGVNKGTDASQKFSAEFLDKINAIQDTYYKSLQEQLALQNQINNKMTDAVGLEATQTLNLQKILNPERDFSVAEQYAPIEAKLGALGQISGLNQQQAASPDAIAER
jgi:hypothetical protein